MPFCKVCQKPLSNYVLNNKPVCLKCDEMLFDMEIESDDFDAPTENSVPSKDKKSVPTKRPKSPTK